MFVNKNIEKEDDVLEKIHHYIRSNKLNVATWVIFIISLCLYTGGLFWFVSQNKTIEAILSSSADFIAICSCILVLLQVIAFVKDSRRNECRARKEFALDLAKIYANDLIIDMAFIQNVLSVHYNQGRPEELFEIVDKVILEEFTLSSLKSKKELKKYYDMLCDKVELIDYDLLLEQSVGFGSIMEMSDLKELDDSKRADVANKRFRFFILETMNKLEYFAMAVNQNIAEGNMLYSSLHQTYIKFIHFVYPKICESNIEFETYYTNVIELYRSWNQEEENDIKLIKSLKKLATKEIGRKYTGRSKKMSEE